MKRAALLALGAVWGLSAQAVIVGAVESGSREGSTGIIQLHDERGPCQGMAFKAEWVPPRGEVVAGCWVAVNGGVVVVFFDGDSAQVPLQSIKRPPDT